MCCHWNITQWYGSKFEKKVILVYAFPFWKICNIKLCDKAMRSTRKMDVDVRPFAWLITSHISWLIKIRLKSCNTSKKNDNNVGHGVYRMWPKNAGGSVFSFFTNLKIKHGNVKQHLNIKKWWKILPLEFLEKNFNTSSIIITYANEHLTVIQYL